jgi:hypothetical protein
MLAFESFSDERDIGNGIFVYLEPVRAMISTSVATHTSVLPGGARRAHAGSWVARASDTPGDSRLRQ